MQEPSKKSGYVGFFWVSHRRKLLYCSVEKAGCSTTKLALKNVNNGRTFHRVGHKAAFSEERYGNYKKMMFVREPVERLVSAYRYNTITHYNHEKTVWIKEAIVKTYRYDNSPIELQANVTFEEFIRFYVDGRSVKTHTVNAETLCKPCTINYDYIGKYETFTDDLAHIIAIFSNLTVNEALKLIPHANQSPGKASAEMADVYMKNISASLREQLYLKLKHEYALFDGKFRW